MLVHAIKKKGETLALSYVTFTKVGATLYEMSKILDSSHKMAKEMEASLKEAQEGWKKMENNLQEIHLENISLVNEYVNVVEDGFFVVHVNFENVLEQVEYFYP